MVQNAYTGLEFTWEAQCMGQGQDPLQGPVHTPLGQGQALSPGQGPAAMLCRLRGPETQADPNGQEKYDNYQQCPFVHSIV